VFLRETLTAVLCQDAGRDRMQILVVDDASPTANTEALVRQIAGDRIVVVRNATNLGLAGCWNKCLSHATGEWIHLLHQDDLVFDGFYGELEATIAAFRGCGAAFTRHCFIDGRGAWLGLSPLECHDRAVLPDWQFRLCTGQRIQCPSIVVRRSVYAELGVFRADLPYCLDWEMWSRIAARHPFAYSPRILAAYRTHARSETSRLADARKLIADQIRTFELLEDRLPADRRAAARQAFRRYLVPNSNAEGDRLDLASAVFDDVVDQIIDGRMPARWYLTAPFRALWAKGQRRFDTWSGFQK
jgi:glycosyltransferase involved in cell wall biosynthesis